MPTTGGGPGRDRREMNQQQWLPRRSPCCLTLPSPALPFFSARRHLSILPPAAISSAAAPDSTPDAVKGGGGGGLQQLTARERRQLRNERRESLAAAGGSWREEVEERLSRRRKKRDKASWKEELNLDNLALLGPQWWVVRVSHVAGQEIAERLARMLARNYPDMDFKVYFPASKVKRKLKNGTYSSKSNALFRGCVFLYCVLNKELHDFIRECDGVGGFVGSKVGNTKRQINKPKPVDTDEMAEIFQQAKQEQEAHDMSFEEQEAVDSRYVTTEQHTESEADSHLISKPSDLKTERQLNKGSRGQATFREVDNKLLSSGQHVHVLSGPFTDYAGQFREINHKNGKAMIGIEIFGKEMLVEVEANQIVAAPT